MPNNLEMRKLLVQYLYEYRACIRNKHIKEKRISDLQRELRPKTNGYGQVFKREQQAAGVTIIVDKIEKRIDDQIQNACNKIVEIMDIIEYLPEESTERMTLELKYIDCKSWPQIERTMNLSKSPCIEWHNKALDKLLENERVQKILIEYKEEIMSKVRTI